MSKSGRIGYPKARPRFFQNYCDKNLYAQYRDDTPLPTRDDTARGLPGGCWGKVVRLTSDGELSRLEVPHIA
jgi:hypothetical protein